MTETPKTTGRTGKIPGWVWWVTALAVAVIAALVVSGLPHGASQGGTNQSWCNIQRENGITPPPGTCG